MITCGNQGRIILSRKLLAVWCCLIPLLVSCGMSTPTPLPPSLPAGVHLSNTITEAITAYSDVIPIDNCLGNLPVAPTRNRGREETYEISITAGFGAGTDIASLKITLSVELNIREGNVIRDTSEVPLPVDAHTFGVWTIDWQDVWQSGNVADGAGNNYSYRARVGSSFHTSFQPRPCPTPTGDLRVPMLTNTLTVMDTGTHTSEVTQASELPSVPQQILELQGVIGQLDRINPIPTEIVDPVAHCYDPISANTSSYPPFPATSLPLAQMANGYGQQQVTAVMGDENWLILRVSYGLLLNIFHQVQPTTFVIPNHYVCMFRVRPDKFDPNGAQDSLILRLPTPNACNTSTC